ncbi:MAG: rhomboid family intramembrane serine protease [Phycisphaerales bacterium]
MPFDPRVDGALGSLRFISFNTWLIISNIAIFVLTHIVFNVPAFQTKVSFGSEYAQGVVVGATSRLEVDERQAYPHPEKPGVSFYIIRDPARVGPNEFGQMELGPTGFLGAQVGRQLFVPMHMVDGWGHFSTARGFFGWEVWRFVTFQFLHANITHLIFNMLGLWFVGGMVERYLGSKRYAAFYLVCGIFGAVMYLLLNTLGTLMQAWAPGIRVPGLLFDNTHTPLVGASAGIFGVLMAAATVAPLAIVDVFGVIPLKMRTAVYLFTGIAIFNLVRDSANAGGEAAHVGGALAGYYFIRRTYLLRDFFDLLGDSRGRRNDGGPGGRFRSPPRAPDQEEVKRVLAKVAQSGLGSLSDEERRTLLRATEAQRRG